MQTDHQDFRTLSTPHLSNLKRWIQKKGLRDEDADDVVQETLLLALRHFHQFRFEASFSTWLFRIAINVIRAQARRPGYGRTIAFDANALEGFASADPGQCPLATLVGNESKARLHDAISKLPHEYRIVVELRDLKGLSIKETAEMLDLSRPALKSRHFRARMRLSTLLSKQLVASSYHAQPRFPPVGCGFAFENATH